MKKAPASVPQTLDKTQRIQPLSMVVDGDMKTALVNDALLMAVQQRQPQAGLIWHTDRGSQYTTSSHRNIIKSHGIVQSMSRKRNS